MSTKQRIIVPKESKPISTETAQRKKEKSKESMGVNKSKASIGRYQEESQPVRAKGNKKKPSKSSLKQNLRKPIHQILNRNNGRVSLGKKPPLTIEPVRQINSGI
jgi:hypothetical protein